MKLFAVMYLAGIAQGSIGPWPDTPQAYAMCMEGRADMERAAAEKFPGKGWTFTCEYREAAPHVSNPVNPSTGAPVQQ